MPEVLGKLKDKVVQPVMSGLSNRLATDDSDDSDYDDDEDVSLLTHGRRRVYKLWDGFTDFAFQGNILELAFGLILANTFTKLVNSFVSDVILPPLSIVFPLDKNMKEKFAVLKPGPHRPPDGYTTLSRAQDDGAVVLAYGNFVDIFLNFLCMGVALYGLALFYQWLSKDDIIKKQTKCRYCRKRINEKAKRCINCTSWLDGREDPPDRGGYGSTIGSLAASAAASAAASGAGSAAGSRFNSFIAPIGRGSVRRDGVREV